MSKVHPIFKAPLHAMQPPHDLGEPLRFDEDDDALMHDIFGKRLWRAAQALLQTYAEIKRVQGSFGEPDKARVFEQIMPELKAFRDGAIDAFKDL